jgi:hypothetical protein
VATSSSRSVGTFLEALKYNSGIPSAPMAMDLNAKSLSGSLKLNEMFSPFEDGNAT